jgi:hypothetical protein
MMHNLFSLQDFFGLWYPRPLPEGPGQAQPHPAAGAAQNAKGPAVPPPDELRERLADILARMRAPGAPGES